MRSGQDMRRFLSIAVTIPIASCCLGVGLVGTSSRDAGFDAGADAGGDAGTDGGMESDADAGPAWWGDAGACGTGTASRLDSSIQLVAGTVLADEQSADLNGDGLLDLVAINFATLIANPLEIFLGLPGGGLGEPQLIASEDETVSVAVGDLNGDGAPDLLVARFNESWAPPSGYYIEVLINERGSFEPVASLYGVTAEYSVVQMAIADLNGDGRSDILYSTFVKNDNNDLATLVQVMLGLPDGGFTAPAPIAFFGGDSVFQVGDFNGDGRADLAGSTANGQQFQVLLNLGDGGFSTTLYPIAVLGGIALLPRPAGPPDLVVGLSGYESDTTVVDRGVEVLRNRGDGTFAPGPTFPVGGFNVVVGDFNGDCFPDIATSSLEPGCDPDGGIWVLYGGGEGDFGEPASLSTLNSNYVWLTPLGRVTGRNELLAGGSCNLDAGLTLYQSAAR